MCLPLAAPAAQQADGDWRLQIEGHHRFVFGDQVLHGYVQIPWEVVLDFSISNGEFRSGVGSARWLDKTVTGSLPPQWIECRLQPGSYLDRNLKMREMPRVRFAKFPLAGALEKGQLQIQPGYQPPGNYLAISYGCDTRNPTASEWFIFATRARDEEGKRQDAETRVAGEHRSVAVREVKSLPPQNGLSLPLQAGWFFQQGSEESEYFAQYRLQRR